MASNAVRYELVDTVAVLTLDDGKVNALSHDVVNALHEGLTRAEREAAAVLLIGRPGRLSAGFELGEMKRSDEAAQKMVGAGAELMLRVFTFPRPVVAACTGHALAAGAIMLLAADLRVGAAGNFKIGLNEVSIHITLPVFVMEMARARLSKRYFTRATTQAEVFDPEGAKDAGYLDATVAPEKLYDVALEHARRLAVLPSPAFGGTKENERGATVRFIRETLAADLAKLTSPK
jgi:enoyl-CoA hydratase